MLSSEMDFYADLQVLFAFLFKLCQMVYNEEKRIEMNYKKIFRYCRQKRGLCMLQAKNVNLYLQKDNRLLIEDFSFSLGEGDKVVIIGEEGNGKSTLLKYLQEKIINDDCLLEK